MNAQGYLSLVLHAHLPFVRHPEHERFLEETWLFEAITESYVPLLQNMERWLADGLDTRLTLTLTPTLCAMLLDPLLQDRYARHLDQMIELTEKEIGRTQLNQAFNQVARMYHRRLGDIRETYCRYERDLIAAFGKFQELGRLEIITSAATHALLPLLASHPPSIRAQILVARDHYRGCFGRDPRGIWLPECAYADAVEPALREAGIRWFITDTRGLLHAQPRPRYGVFAPIFTPNGLAAFGRDPDSARQVWSRQEGYPGDARYRDFYRDIGFDLDWDYVRPHLPVPDRRGFTGIKYHRITDGRADKEAYDRPSALAAVAEHAEHFLQVRRGQIRRLAGVLDRPPLVLAPYDAELFGHWWYEGPEFLDRLVRGICRDPQETALITPGEYLRRHPTNQVAQPAAGSWGEEGYWRIWLNETNSWILPHLQMAQEGMTELAERFSRPDALQQRVLRQAARELLLAQASDWPFILRTGTSPEYARRRVTDHLLRFRRLYENLNGAGLDEIWLAEIEAQDSLFPKVNPRHWAVNS